MRVPCTCCNRCEDGQCPSSSPVVRKGCGGQLEYALSLAIAGDADVTRTQVRSGPSAWLDVLPTLTQLAIGLEMTPSVPPPGPANAVNPGGAGRWAWFGRYKRLSVNGEVHEFNGLTDLGLAVALTPSTSHFSGYPTKTNTGGTYTVTFSGSDPVKREVIELGVGYQAGPTLSEGAGGFSAGFTVNGNVYRERATTVTFEGSEGEATYGAWYREGFLGDGAGVSPIAVSGVTSAVDPDPMTDACEGATQTGTMTLPTDGDAAFGDWTMGLVHPATVPIPTTHYAARDCPCALDVTGTLYLMGYAETGGTLDGGHDEEGEPLPAPGPQHYVPGTLALRLVRLDTTDCDFIPLAQWSAQDKNDGSAAGVVTCGGVDYEIREASLERVGPKLYRLRGNVAARVDGLSFYPPSVPPFDVYLTVADTCPTGEATCEQFEQPHKWTGTAFSGGGISNSAVDPLPETLPSGTAAAYVPIVAGDTGENTFTANALTLAESETVEANDPDCGECGGPPCHDCETANNTLGALPPCDGLPTIAIVKTSIDPCAYEGIGGDLPPSIDPDTEDVCRAEILALGGNDHLTATVTALEPPPQPDWWNVDEYNGVWPDDGWSPPSGLAVGTVITLTYADGPPRYRNGFHFIGCFLSGAPSGQHLKVEFNNESHVYSTFYFWSDVLGVHTITGNDGSQLTVRIESPLYLIYHARTRVVGGGFGSTAEDKALPKSFEYAYGDGISDEASTWLIVSRRPCDAGPVGDDYAVVQVIGTPPCEVPDTMAVA